jgi:DMSO/TMAO reductase YedYZ molybdopterin-dependent catalytic subunit
MRNINILNIVFLILLVVIISSCNINQNNNIIPLSSVEIKNYKGEKLSSINDFHENSIKGPQYIDISKYHLEINGLVENPINLTYDQILQNQHYSKIVTLYCVEGWDAKINWEGILLKDIINNAKIKPDANTIILYAYDGYSTSFPLNYILNNNIMIAYKMNNITLPPERGFPFQLVAEQKWGYKWIKWITKIELSNDTNYKGFWESKGYNNNGSLDGPKLEENK